jgi:hypothetical protein
LNNYVEDTINHCIIPTIAPSKYEGNCIRVDGQDMTASVASYNFPTLAYPEWASAHYFLKDGTTTKYAYSHNTEVTGTPKVALKGEEVTGDQAGFSCNTIPLWVNPEPPAWATTVGNCRRVDLAAITQVIPEGAVADAAACK